MRFRTALVLFFGPKLSNTLTTTTLQGTVKHSASCAGDEIYLLSKDVFLSFTRIAMLDKRHQLKKKTINIYYKMKYNILKYNII